LAPSITGVAHPGAAPDARLDHPRRDEVAVRCHDRCAVDIKAGGEFAFGRQQRADGQVAGLDVRDHLRDDLPIERRRIFSVEMNVHPCFLPLAGRIAERSTT